jgi:hypothetical protein
MLQNYFQLHKANIFKRYKDVDFNSSTKNTWILIYIIFKG